MLPYIITISTLYYRSNYNHQHVTAAFFSSPLLSTLNHHHQRYIALITMTIITVLFLSYTSLQLLSLVHHIINGTNTLLQSITSALYYCHLQTVNITIIITLSFSDLLLITVANELIARPPNVINAKVAH